MLNQGFDSFLGSFYGADPAPASVPVVDPYAAQIASLQYQMAVARNPAQRASLASQLNQLQVQRTAAPAPVAPVTAAPTPIAPVAAAPVAPPASAWQTDAANGVKWIQTGWGQNDPSGQDTWMSSDGRQSTQDESNSRYRMIEGTRLSEQDMRAAYAGLMGAQGQGDQPIDQAAFEKWASTVSDAGVKSAMTGSPYLAAPDQRSAQSNQGAPAWMPAGTNTASGAEGLRSVALSIAGSALAPMLAGADAGWTSGYDLAGGGALTSPSYALPGSMEALTQGYNAGISASGGIQVAGEVGSGGLLGTTAAADAGSLLPSIAPTEAALQASVAPAIQSTLANIPGLSAADLAAISSAAGAAGGAAGGIFGQAGQVAAGGAALAGLANGGGTPIDIPGLGNSTPLSDVGTAMNPGVTDGNGLPVDVSKTPYDTNFTPTNIPGKGSSTPLTQAGTDMNPGTLDANGNPVDVSQYDPSLIKQIADLTGLSEAAVRKLGGAAIGALAGGLGRGAKPAGTTTTTQDLPEWMKSRVIGNLDAAKAYMDVNPQDTSLLTAGQQQLGKTIGGDYLNSNPANPFHIGAMGYVNPALAALSPGARGDYVGLNPGDSGYRRAENYTNASMDYLRPTARGDFLNSNPYIDATYQQALDPVLANISSRFTSAGRYGSGASQFALGDAAQKLATNVYGQNYANERSNMMNAGQYLTSADQAQQAARLAGSAGLSSNYANDRNNQLGFANAMMSGEQAQQTSRLNAANAYGGNFNTAREQQVNAATNAPAYVTNATNAAFSPFGNYANLLKSNVSSTTTPYFNNPVGGALSGALAGYGLSKAFG